MLPNCWSKLTLKVSIFYTQEMSTYFVNCVNDAAADECVRNALRVIEANRFRYKKFKFPPTNNITRTVGERLDFFSAMISDSLDLKS